jgi:hypothetical protein
MKYKKGDIIRCKPGCDIILEILEVKEESYNTKCLEIIYKSDGSAWEIGDIDEGLLNDYVSNTTLAEDYIINKKLKRICG